ncbi:CDP-diacylglycerol--serine O-phosphatidyltransferase [Balneolaceae bacterium ANBcel3]|nr:CDP-diacylglycerol--serine O-phosphatidyltransferase [Balneolaceae bacterium ANBcel3]
MSSESRLQRKQIRRDQLRRKFRRPIPRTVVPSFFTLMNLFCGFVSIILVSDGKYEFGAWLIVMAAVFDMMDGFMARLANADSEFGIELDSLSDIVSFGVAPAFLFYSFVMHELMIIGLIIAAFPALCGAIRLARFNINAKIEDQDVFKGLPIPAHAMMLVALFLIFHQSPELFESFKYGFNSVLIPIFIVLSVLMVSTVPFDKIPRFKKQQLKEQKGKVYLFLFYFISVVTLQEYGLILVFTVFILKGIVTAMVRFWKELHEELV